MIQDTVKHRFDSMRGFGTDDVLAALGLERRRSGLDIVLPAAGMFIAGVMVGASAAFLLAPKSGRETRRELKGRATDLSRRISSTAGNLAHDVFGKEDTGSRKVPEISTGTDQERRMSEIHRPPPPPHTSGPLK